MAKAGLKAIYLSGWQVAAESNTAGQTYPDQSLYPVNSVPQLIKRINNVRRGWGGGGEAGGGLFRARAKRRMNQPARARGERSPSVHLAGAAWLPACRRSSAPTKSSLPRAAPPATTTCPSWPTPVS